VIFRGSSFHCMNKTLNSFIVHVYLCGTLHELGLYICVAWNYDLCMNVVIYVCGFILLSCGLF
jgi:biotin transporter BioY